MVGRLGSVVKDNETVCENDGWQRGGSVAVRDDPLKTVPDGDGQQEDVGRCDRNRADDKLGTTQHTGPLPSVWPSGDSRDLSLGLGNAPPQDRAHDRTSRHRIPFPWPPLSKVRTHTPTPLWPGTPPPNLTDAGVGRSGSPLDSVLLRLALISGVWDH